MIHWCMADTPQSGFVANTACIIDCSTLELTSRPKLLQQPSTPLSIEPKISSSKSSKGAAIKQKVNEQLAKFRTTPVVTSEQKLHVQIDSMKKEAHALNSDASQLEAKAATFATRAGTTPSPSAPPPKREPLIERHPAGAPSNYDAQVRAYNVLETDWKAYEKEVKAFEKKLDTFAKTLAHMKEKHFETEKAVGKTEHEFIGLDNALHNLKLQKIELSKAVAAVPLPGVI